MIKRLIRQNLSALLSVGLFSLLLLYVDSSNIYSQIKNVPATSVGLVFLCCLTTPIWATLRFWRMLDHFGVRISWVACLKATVSGQVASLFMIPVFGQVVGRQLLLTQSGLSSESNAALATYERLATTIISSLCALAGAGYLLAPRLIDELIAKIDLPSIVIPLVAGILISCFLGLSDFEKSVFSRLGHLKNIRNFLEIIVISFAGYAAMIVAFLSIFQVVAPNASLLSLLAAAVLVSFVASLPISVGGWGPRELTTAYVLGILGVAVADAIAASVVVGAMSIVSLLLVALSVSRIPTKSGDVSKERVNKRNEAMLEKESAWFFGMSVAALLFFQAKISFGNTFINLNLADPFAFLALIALLLSALLGKQYPKWQFEYFNWVLFLGTCLLIFGFFWGFVKNGFSHWAFSGKLLGWFILLGYLSAGYSIVAYHGAQGIQRSISSLLSVGIAIACYSLIFNINFSSYYDANFLENLRIEKALALQLLPIMSLTLGAYAMLMKMATKTKAQGIDLLLYVAIGLLFLSLWDEIKLCALVVILMSWFLCSVPKKVVQTALLVAIFSWVCSEGLFWGFSLHVDSEVVASSNTKALELWKTSPFLGVGLGGFIEAGHPELEQPVIINSTPIWILTEFGVLGLSGFLCGVTMLLKHALSDPAGGTQKNALLLLLVGISVLSMFQEVLYQRVLWFSLGILLAKPNSVERNI